MGARHGWRVAFWVVGLPGLVLAIAGLFIRDPGRGASEGRDPANRPPRPRLADYATLFKNPTFLLNTAGLAAVTFVSGGFAAWGATFYQRVHGLTPASAGRWIGGMTALAGLLGISLGTALADALARRTRRAYLLLASAAVFIAVPFGMLAILDPYWRSSLPLLFIAMLMMAAVLGPCNTVTANVVPAHLRAAGFAVSIFLIHLFGDIASPVIIGELSTWAGQPAIAGTAFGHLLAGLGINPVQTPQGPTNLTLGMLTIIPVMIFGSFFFLLGSRHLPSDQDRAHEASLSANQQHLAARPDHVTSVSLLCRICFRFRAIDCFKNNEISQTAGRQKIDFGYISNVRTTFVISPPGEISQASSKWLQIQPRGAENSSIRKAIRRFGSHSMISSICTEPSVATTLILVPTTSGVRRSNSALLIPGTTPYPRKSGHLSRFKIWPAISSGLSFKSSSVANLMGFMANSPSK